MENLNQRQDEKAIEGALLFKLVCSMNQGNYANHAGYIKVENAIDQLKEIKRKGYSLVDIYYSLKVLERKEF